MLNPIFNQNGYQILSVREVFDFCLTYATSAWAAGFIGFIRTASEKR